MTIKDLGRSENLEMVHGYTRIVTFHDFLKFYKPPLSGHKWAMPFRLTTAIELP